MKFRKLQSQQILLENHVVVKKHDNRLSWWRKCWEWADGESPAYYSTDETGHGVYFIDSRRNRRVEILAPFQFSAVSLENPEAWAENWMNHSIA